MTLATRVGDVALSSPVLVASGTAGYGAELAGYGDLAHLGGVVAKSLAAFPWAGNAPPRVVPAGDGLLNSVGLAGPGVAAWRGDGLATLNAAGATVVGSIWGRTTAEFAAAAAALRGAGVVAVEVNASCPNLEDRSRMFAHSPSSTAAVVEAAADAAVPRWVKLSPNTPDLVAVARAAVAAGADALVLTNTLLGMRLNVTTRAPSLGGGGGGLSGAPLFAVAVRAIYECRAALPTVPIVGVGGVRSGAGVVEMVLAGADAVEVGTAIFAEPRAPWRIQRELARWMSAHRVGSLSELRGMAHG